MGVRQIILIENKPPQFEGGWKVGEVLAMAQALAAWVEQLQVSPPAPEAPPEPAAKGNE